MIKLVKTIIIGAALAIAITAFILLNKFGVVEWIKF